MFGLVVARVLTCTELDAVNELGRSLVIVDSAVGRVAAIVALAEHDDDASFLQRTHRLDAVYTFPPDAVLLPGFVDCHVHLTIARGDYQVDHLRQSSADNAMRALRVAQGLQRAGFTTLRSAGEADTAYPVIAVARAIARGDFEGPRIVGAGHYISVTGGGGDLNDFSCDNGRCAHADGLVVDGPDAMRMAVRSEIKYGADWIKLLVTGAFMTAGTSAKDSPEHTHFGDDELRACVDEARRRCVPVMAHAHGAAGIVTAARAGCRSIEHASFIDEAGVAACLEMGTFIVPTFMVGEHFGTTSDAAQSRLLELQRITNERYYACIQRAATAGVRVALGSDYVGWPCEQNAREFALMVRHGGLTPTQSLLAGTRVAAELLQLDDVGRVCVGARADLVICTGDPLADITVLELRVHSVFQGGRRVRGPIDGGR